MIFSKDGRALHAKKRFEKERGRQRAIFSGFRPLDERLADTQLVDLLKWTAAEAADYRQAVAADQGVVHLTAAMRAVVRHSRFVRAFHRVTC